jgi:hypothetical protein
MPLSPDEFYANALDVADADGRLPLATPLAERGRRSVAPKSAKPPTVVSRSFVPSLPIRIINGHRYQCDRCDLTNLCIGELAEATDALHHAFDRSLVRTRARPDDTSPVEHDGKIYAGHRAGRGGGCTAA